MNRLIVGAPDKTDLILQFLRADIERGFTLIADRSLAEKAANLIPIEHTQRVLFLDPSDFDYPAGFNVLAGLVTTIQKDAKSGATRTPIPAQGGQQSGDCGQQVMAA